MKKLIYYFCRIINRIIPKDPHRVIFHSFPDVSDNSFALFEYIARHDKIFFSKNTVVWLLNKDNPVIEEHIADRMGTTNVKFIKRLSLRGIYAFFRSKIIVSTHGCFSSITIDKQVSFNLWHGMPFKKIGYMLNDCNGEKTLKADLTIATSHVFQRVMARCFNISENKVFLTSCPRNDYLFSNKDSLHKLSIDRKQYKKVIFWLPTYRRSIIGDIRLDGNENAFCVTDVLKKYYKELNELLKVKKYLLIIKPHPMDIIDKSEFPSSNNVIFIHNSELIKRNVQLYELLANSDSLITDYSSVFIDYIATKKPIAFTVGDIVDYSLNRGFIFEPPLDYLPGETIKSIDDFMDYLKFYEQKNRQWQKKYDKISKKFNLFNEPVSSENVYKLLIETMNNL